MRFDLFAIMVIIADIFASIFLIWRATHKKATLWGAARFIYWYIAVITLYHAVIYFISLFSPNISEQDLVYKYLHPIVLLYVVNPVLIAIIHWRGGHIL
jgi:hypothetical protein